jgi:hypothetical protein
LQLLAYGKSGACPRDDVREGGYLSIWPSYWDILSVRTRAHMVAHNGPKDPREKIR